MTKIFVTFVFTIFIATSLSMGIFMSCNSPSKENSVNKTSGMDESSCSAKYELKTDMRKLWEDHVTWTRNVILNIMDDLPGTDQAVKRLLHNQDEIGNAIKPYYGDDAGKKLTALLHTHITQAADLLKAAKTNNKTEFDKINKDWYSNADEISTFLSNANPNWKLEDMKEMMHTHLKYTTDEAVARQKKDYEGDIAAYDRVHEEILKMSDMIYMGIVKRFPEKIK